MNELPDIALSTGAHTLWELRQQTGLALPGLSKKFKTWLRDELRAHRLIPYLSGRYGSPSQPAYTGTVSAHPKGFGFATGTPSSQEAFLTINTMATLLTEDVVHYHLFESKNGKGQVAEVFKVDRPESFWTGTLGEDSDGRFLLPDHPATPKIRVQGAPSDTPVEAVVLVRIPEGTPLAETVYGLFVRVVGVPGAPGFDTDYSIATHRLDYQFSAELLESVQAVVGQKELSPAGRKDLRDLCFFTVDGESTRDIDDALCITPTATGYNVKVAIADVSYYVEYDSPLDKVARQRATSVYFPDRVIPMLPEGLSNGVCSLVPDQDRAVVVCDANVSIDGVVERYEFYPALVRSRAQLTYNLVATFAEGLRLAVPDIVHEQLADLIGLTAALEAAREHTPTLPLESKDLKLTTSAEGLVHLKWQAPTVAHRYVELAMLMANQCAADFLKREGYAALFRHHRSPETAAWLDARANLALKGLSLPEEPSLSAMADMIHSTRSRPDAGPIESLLLKTLQTATYDAEHADHFSLAVQKYAHFTSPIRRYPDLAVHRAIKACLLQQPAPDVGADLAAHCSHQALRAHRASQFVWTKVKRRYIAQHCQGQESAASFVKASGAKGAKVYLQEWQTMAWLQTDEKLVLEEGAQLRVKVVSASDADVQVVPVGS